MKKLDELELKKIEGGGISAWAIVGIGLAITFVAGIIDGIARPLKCNG